jgi:hypothetical protein
MGSDHEIKAAVGNLWAESFLTVIRIIYFISVYEVQFLVYMT